MLSAIHYFCSINPAPLKPKKVVITGGPGTGKSSVIHQLERAGFYCFHEVIRSMTFQAKKEVSQDGHVSNPLAFVPDPYLFNKQLLSGRLRHFMEGRELDQTVVFYDRGLPDVLAYMDYFKQEYGSDFIAACENNRYDKVLLLPPWEEIYISDNERLESFEEAIQIHEYLLDTYRRFGYKPINIPQGTVEERTAHVLLELTRDSFL